MKALHPAASAAVTLSSNGNSDILFTGGGLVINMTTGTGLNITGGAGPD